VTQRRGEEKRAKILRYVSYEHARDGYSPSIRDIASAIKSSPATTHRHIRILKDQGLIDFKPGVSRTIRVVRRKAKNPLPHEADRGFADRTEVEVTDQT
jgi:SOS-response transcriptional repressor LexA